MSRDSNHVRVLEAVGEARDTVRCLWQLFMYDISDVSGHDVQENGCFDSSYLLEDTDDSSCLPFLIAVGDSLAGLAIVMARKKVNLQVATRLPDYYIKDFFILRKYQRRGAGRAAVNEIWDSLPGKWAVAQLFNAEAATAFWRAVISERTGGNFVEEPEAGVVLQSGFRMQQFFIAPTLPSPD